MRSRTLSAFTVIEVMVVVAVLGLLAALITVNYSRAQLAARDSHRKQDVTTYSQAVGSYLTANGNAAIQNKSGNLNCNNLSNTTLTPTQDPGQVVGGSGCVGSNGRGYGLVNASKSQTVGLNDSTFSTNVRKYSTASIASTLKSLGYLSSISTDPQAKNPDDASSGSADYILLRCCNDGRQNISAGGSTYAVWTHLETAPAASSADATNSASACGGSAAAQKAATTTSIPGYQYDYASGTTMVSGYMNYAAGPAIGATSFSGACKADTAA